MSKYIDLIVPVSESEEIGSSVRHGVKLALKWLDAHPDRVPGRTITESDYSDIAEWARNYSNRGWEGRTVLAERGITIAPDPEPTNAEKLAQLHDQYTRFPVQHLPGNGSFADYLDHKGVRAPDHD